MAYEKVNWQNITQGMKGIKNHLEQNSSGNNLSKLSHKWNFSRIYNFLSITISSKPSEKEHRFYKSNWYNGSVCFELWGIDAGKPATHKILSQSQICASMQWEMSLILPETYKIHVRKISLSRHLLYILCYIYIKHTHRSSNLPSITMTSGEIN